jgi:hypothetical protein
MSPPDRSEQIWRHSGVTNEIRRLDLGWDQTLLQKHDLQHLSSKEAAISQHLGGGTP